MKIARRLPWLALIALLAASLISAGCGKALTKKEYEKELTKIVKSFGKKLDKLVAGTEQPKGEDFEKAADEFAKLSGDVEDLSPPKSLEKQHDKLVKALEDSAEDMKDLAPKIDKAGKDPAKMAEVYTKFGEAKGFKDLQKVTEDLEKEGIKLDP